MLRVEFKFLKRRCTAWRHITTIAARETILRAQSLVWPRLKSADFVTVLSNSVFTIFRILISSAEFMLYSLFSESPWNSESVQIPYKIINDSLWAKLTCLCYTIY